MLTWLWRITLGGGMLGAVCEFIRLGTWDTLKSLTYAGRLSGLSLLSTGILILVVFVLGFISTPAFWLPALVSCIVLILVFNALLFSLQVFDAQYLGGHLWIWSALLVWSVACLFTLHRKVGGFTISGWPTGGVAIGAVVTVVLAVSNFGYTQIYEPYSSSPLISVSLTLKASGVIHGVTTVSVTTRVTNEGEVGVYVLGTLYQVSGRKADVTSKPQSSEDMRHQWSLQSQLYQLSKYSDVLHDGYETVGQGQFLMQGGALDAGADVTSVNLIEIPVAISSKFDQLNAHASIEYLRKDRATLRGDSADEAYSNSGRTSWSKKYAHNKDAPEWVAPANVDFIKYQAELIHGSSIFQYTRGTQYVTVWWVLAPPKRESPYGPYLIATIAPQGGEIYRPSIPRRVELASRYGLGNSSSGYSELLLPHGSAPAVPSPAPSSASVSSAGAGVGVQGK